jgi:hypothetical protein
MKTIKSRTVISCEKCEHSTTCAILNPDVCKNYALAVSTNFKVDGEVKIDSFYLFVPDWNDI